VEVAAEYVIPAEYGDMLRQGRDADIALPYETFRQLLTDSLQGSHVGMLPLDMRHALAEARRLLQNMEDKGH
jgi:hypothetical protein